ncbi:bifunctional hydroxymethylpyrimidine kinase/phosphomethylpyrimidine kinase [Alkalicoccobacillus porphyridii]|uniref:Hydroxymethylpyrimidine/phosphomethylpyrimidine kinase n=1 Tax=Alkalicoccobacillus porphyridii TaxID=2597270 RepID=A0A553ZZ30_9BACI|nr:bifunctional hydroxymethylpyrimidine kinase/phosphomethylpyrimidine kinase [Alkalicoccobacillus porphyridii]TSB46700.1 bifunctional hydroxymethylpyrimidine kinase/phosphomethylpyrimidine kinase [Alkalicoccobacillus porphyridii]
MSLKKVLTIAGSDSSGGAGIQADLKTFQELDTYGMSAITAITAQNTLGVQSVLPIPPAMLHQQLESVLSDIGADAIKTGMLVSSEHIMVIADMLATYQIDRVVIDPVLGSTSGSELTRQDAIITLKKMLWPMAKVVTPNLLEAAILLECPPIESVKEMEEAVIKLYDFGAPYVLLKGGHLPSDQSIDLLFDGETVHHFSSPRIKQRHTHGTGCTLASAIAAELAKGVDVITAVQTAKSFMNNAIKEGIAIGSGSGPINQAANRHRSNE